MTRPIGTARVVIATAAAVLLLLCVTLAAIAGVANGLLLGATICLAVFLWAIGAHRAAFWNGPDA